MAAIAKTKVAKEHIPTTNVRTAIEILIAVALSETMGLAANVVAIDLVSKYAPVAKTPAIAAPLKLRRSVLEFSGSGFIVSNR